jgi:hypothetical protein
MSVVGPLVGQRPRRNTSLGFEKTIIFWVNIALIIDVNLWEREDPSMEEMTMSPLPTWR